MPPKNFINSHIPHRHITNKVFPGRDINKAEIYRPLVFFDEIRLLRLLPGRPRSKLVGELIHVRLKDEPSYQAVSYTWADDNGDISMTGSLYFSDICLTMTISKKCDAALRRFRCDHSRKFLWIDSVCIDQNSPLELGNQVKIMPTVYSSARKVLVFLGQRIGRSIGYWNPADFESLLKKLKRNCNVIANELLSPNFEKLTGSEECAWRYFLERRWFTRVWTLQEVMLAKSATFFLGSLKLDWEDLCMFNWPDHHKPAIFELWDAKERTSEKILSLEETLCIASRCNATKPHDKVYAILGLLDPNLSRWIQPDYRKPPEQVFKETTEACIKLNKRPSILSMINHSKCNGPSWVVDFSRPLIKPEWYHTTGPHWIYTLNTSIRGRPQFWRKRQPDPTPELPWSINNPAFFNIDSKLLRVEGNLAEIVKFSWKSCQEAAEKLHRLVNDYNFMRTIYQSYSQQVPQLDCFEYGILRIAAEIFYNSPESDQFARTLPKTLLRCLSTTYRFLRPQDYLYDVDLLAIDLLAPAIEKREKRLLNEDRAYLLTTRMVEYLNFLTCEDTIFFGEHSIGFGPSNVQEGDLVYNIEGVPSQIILRRANDGFRVVGRCSTASFGEGIIYNYGSRNKEILKLL